MGFRGGLEFGGSHPALQAGLCENSCLKSRDVGGLGLRVPKSVEGSLGNSAQITLHIIAIRCKPV